jgi:uncharacterized protein (DUF342 family)
MDLPIGIVVKHAADRMKAYVSLSSDFGQVTVGMVLMELLNKGVVHGLDMELIQSVVGTLAVDKYVEVAAGTAPLPGRDGRVEVLVPVEKGEVGSFEKFIVVKRGDSLVYHVPPVPGADGMDVFGNVLSAPQAKDVPFIAGDGVEGLSSNPDVLVATCDGVLKRHPEDGLIEVRPYRELRNDVERDLGRVSFTGDMKIAGSVRAGSNVVVTGALMITGTVEGAAVRCGGDLSVGAGVRGGGKAVIECDGSLWADCIEGAKILSGGAVTVSVGIVDSEISARGRVKAKNIAGGKVVAAGGVSADRIGNDDEDRTVIDVGGIHRYAGQRAVLADSMVAQRLLTEGCASELFSFVRDNMGSDGRIHEDKLHNLEWYEKSLNESVSRCRELEKNVSELDDLMKELSGCNISANEIYPNVMLKLGFADRQVKGVMRNVLLKPSGVMH